MFHVIQTNVRRAVYVYLMLCRWMCHRHYQKAHCSQGCADGSAHLTPEHEASEEIDDGDLPPTEEPAPNTTVGVPVIAEGAAANTKPWDFLFDLEFNYGLVDQSNIISSDYQFKFDCIGPKPQHRLRYIGSFNNVH